MASTPAPSTNASAAWTGRRLAHYKLPSRVIVLPEFPRNATGKARRSEIRAAFR